MTGDHLLYNIRLFYERIFGEGAFVLLEAPALTLDDKAAGGTIAAGTAGPTA